MRFSRTTDWYDKKAYIPPRYKFQIWALALFFTFKKIESTYFLKPLLCNLFLLQPGSPI